MANAKKKNKALLVVVAVMVAAVMLLGGTFAWQSISQEALNEISATANPGGRLHDDFHETTVEGEGLTKTYDKNVYVENYTTYADNGTQIFARVKLDEYLEFIDAENNATSLVPGAVRTDKTTWTSYVPNAENDPFRKYYTLTLADEGDASTKYMPTFNKNADSLAADINGTQDANFADYVDYSLTENATKKAIYDGDDNTTDEFEKENPFSFSEAELEAREQWGEIIRVEETHTVKDTLTTAEVISMETWMSWQTDSSDTNDIGNFWVYDTDGWFYWANPINPETATGLLLDNVTRTQEVINSDWYYAINVVAQFISYDDLGSDDNTGFYADGEAPSTEALLLLEKIGVEVSTEVPAETPADELISTFNQGGVITLAKESTSTTNGETVVNAPAVINLNGGTLNSNNGFKESGNTAENVSALTVAADTTILGGTVKNEQGYAISLKDEMNGADTTLTIKDGTYLASTTAINVVKGTLIIEGGFFAENSDSDNGHYLINCIDANYNDGSAKVIIKGGTFVNWNPADNTSEGAGTNFLAEGYTVQIDNTDPERILYTVVPVTE